jgi:HKD family nuclease
MAKKEFVLQGFTKRTHGDVIRELFDIQNIERVLISVAFVSESGVERIEAQLKAHATKVSVFAGVRNDITSYQGLKRLVGIAGSTIYGVDTGSRHVVFHPKLYLVRGNAKARLSVGSANLTLGGLNNNIEAGMALEFDLGDPSDKAIVDLIETQLLALPMEYPEHIKRIQTDAALDELLASGRVVDEMATPPPRPSTSAGSGGATDIVPRIKLKVVPMRRALAKANAAAKKPKAQKAAPLAKAGVLAPKPIPASVGVEFELVWESKALAQRDLQIPMGENTHKTGSINLDQGLLAADVDFQTYFRDEVFSSLKWDTRSATVDEAYGKFQLVLKGISYGDFDVPISHTTSKEKAQKQRNALTRLRWGPMKDYIARPDLIGRTLALYRDKVDPTRFVLEID